MIKGILQALLYHMIAFTFAGIAYLIAGHDYAHAPGYHHIIITFAIACGFVWMIGCVLYYFFAERSEKLKGVILTHFVFVTAFAALIYYIIQEI